MPSPVPFTYPRNRLVRKQRPPVFADYGKYKPFLREEFGRQCVYCRMPDGPKTPAQFGADHYKPQKKFPGLAAAYSNLFYSCNACNSRKQDFWPTAAQLKRDVYIPNSCQHKMSQHLRYQQGEVIGRTTAGNWTIDLLDLNHDADVTYRGWVLRQIERTLADWIALRARLGKIKKALGRGLASPSVAQLNSQRSKLRAALAVADADLKMLTGAD